MDQISGPKEDVTLLRQETLVVHPIPAASFFQFRVVQFLVVGCEVHSLGAVFEQVVWQPVASLIERKLAAAS